MTLGTAHRTQNTAHRTVDLQSPVPEIGKGVEGPAGGTQNAYDISLGVRWAMGASTTTGLKNIDAGNQARVQALL